MSLVFSLASWIFLGCVIALWFYKDSATRSKLVKGAGFSAVILAFFYSIAVLEIFKSGQTEGIIWPVLWAAIYGFAAYYFLERYKV